MKKRNIGIGILYISGLLVCMLILSVFLRPTYADGVSSETPNTLDYLVVGDSEAYSTFSPMQLFNEHGFVGYNMGIGGQYTQDAYYKLEEVLNVQNPKLVVIETNLLFRKRNIVTSFNTAFKRIASKYFGVIQYHDQWKKVDVENLGKVFGQKDTKIDPVKGFIYQTPVNPYSSGTYVNKTTKRGAIPTVSEDYLNRMIELCRSRNTEVFLYTSPSPINFKYENYNAIEKYASDQGLTYIDFNQIYDQVGIDWSTDTYDRGDHLNASGAKKISQYLGNYIAEHYSLADHRNDPAYVSWQAALTNYKKMTKSE